MFHTNISQPLQKFKYFVYLHSIFTIHHNSQVTKLSHIYGLISLQERGRDEIALHCISYSQQKEEYADDKMDKKPQCSKSKGAHLQP